ncbi:Uncharacterized protein TCM_040670 [Theobroma cacao]|uniref:Uncharacterized protein n=1 Tax=Theobroma cacao TaxID=3641 RepID=A0A061GZ96_THECC|nr:Uncharacterized protein TCM_040670 [Theobroma cacao]
MRKLMLSLAEFRSAFGVMVPIETSRWLSQARWEFRVVTIKVVSEHGLKIRDFDFKALDFKGFGFKVVLRNPH